MNQEQFGQFWAELKAPLRAKWGKITEVDLIKIEGILASFQTIVHERYGVLEKQDVLERKESSGEEECLHENDEENSNDL